MKILIVSDDNNLIEELSEKLIFLRDDDAVINSNCKNALFDVKSNQPDVILICESPDCITLINDIKEFIDSPILMICKSKNADLILEAADAGLEDYIILPVEDYELVLKIISTVKYHKKQQKAVKNVKLLEQIKVIDEISGFYNNAYSKQVIENVIDLDFIKAGMFMSIGPQKSGKAKFSADKLFEAVKSGTRCDDIVTLGKGTNIYILMPNISLNGAIVVLNKIKDSLKFGISAGICDIKNRKFDDFEDLALKAMADAISTEKDYIFVEVNQDETLDEWLDNSTKGYKLFRQMFNKKLEKVITPVFYRLQKSYEEKLYDTKIEQTVSDERCEFVLKNKINKSSLKIIYPGFSKIVISMEHEGLDSPENQEIKLQLSGVTQKELVDIIENFIKEFKSRDYVK